MEVGPGRFDFYTTEGENIPMRTPLSILILFTILATGCGKKSGDGADLPGPGNTALGLKASDCGEHVWEKNFWLHDRSPRQYGDRGWEISTVKATSINGNGKSTNTLNYSQDPRCRSLERALSSGIGKWESDASFLIVEASSINPRIAIDKGDIYVYLFDLEILPDLALPTTLDGFDAEVLSGTKNLDITELKASLEVSLGTSSSATYRTAESKPVELKCNKPFSYRFSFAESNKTNATCRKVKDSAKNECLRAELVLGNDCVFKASSYEVIDEKGQTIKADLGGYLQLTTRRDGSTGYDLSISSVTLNQG